MRYTMGLRVTLSFAGATVKVSSGYRRSVGFVSAGGGCTEVDQDCRTGCAQQLAERW
jgi:hypothetical protein